VEGNIPDTKGLDVTDTIAITPQWFTPAGIKPSRLLVQAFANSDGVRRLLTPHQRGREVEPVTPSRPEGGIHASIAINLWPVQSRPSPAGSDTFYWLVTPDMEGRWRIEFEIREFVLKSGPFLEKLKIPVLLQLAGPEEE
ncbi:MAG TPA: hypothetical protein VGC93_16155, partial [Thermoanaerobaculia bacterium]